MGLLTSAIRELRVATIEGPYPITAGRVYEWLAGGVTSTGASITPENALKIATVWACVRLISEDVGAMPLILYKRIPRGKERAIDHPLYSLLHNSPNPYMTAMQFRETLMGHLLLRGNAYAEIERDGAGRIVALWPLRADRMEVPKLAQDGSLLYTYHPPSGASIELPQVSVMHIRGLSGDGIMGYGPIQMQRELLAHGQAAIEYGNRFYGNDATPGGVLTFEQKLSDEAYGRIQKHWADGHQGVANARRVAILEQGVKWQQVGIAPEDSQFLETRKFSRSEIAGMFRVPPHMIGDLERATFSNIEEQSIQYVTETLDAWLARWEQQIWLSLLLPVEQALYFAEFMRDAKLRGKTLDRVTALSQQWWMTPNEKRSVENMNPLGDEFDEPFIPANNVLPLSKVPDPAAAVPAVAPARGMTRTVRRLPEGGFEFPEAPIGE